MPDIEPERSFAARKAAELALVRVCHHCGRRPGFVLIGGLVPGLLCSDASIRHAGTTDVDVQVDLEIAGNAANAARLEQALLNAEFSPDAERCGDGCPLQRTGQLQSSSLSCWQTCTTSHKARR